MPFRLPSSRINWTNSAFLSGTALLTVTAVPWYLWRYGLDTFQVVMFLAFCIATGLSITLGYHRLFSHIAFKASWPVRLLALAFGAATFENHVIAWVSDHRRHHKFVDLDNDPYDISKGFWYAHIGWILFRIEPEAPWDNVADLERDPLVQWQKKYYVLIAVMVSFVLPTVLGGLHGGWIGALGGLLIGGVARITVVQHSTFFINSLCHTIGSRPYSTDCSARDSAIMALFTFGEGYHNYHHEFQHDYRNGVKWWHWDPTKWTIWTLEKMRLVKGLRRVSADRIILAEIAEARRRLDKRLSCPNRPLCERAGELLRTSDAKLHLLAERWAASTADYAHQTAVKMEMARSALAEKRREFRAALAETRLEVRRAFELLKFADTAVA